MKYVCITPAVEEILRREIERHLSETVRVSEIFTNTGRVNVSLIHPFEYFFAKSQGANPGQRAGNLFPSVTIISESDNPIDTMEGRRSLSINEEFVRNLEAESQKRGDERSVIVSADTVKALRERLAGRTDFPVFGYQSHMSERLSIEVWADNNIVKNRLYSILLSFLRGRCAEILLKEENIDVQIESVIGNRSGNYNFDFGKTLFGAVVTFEVQYFTQELYFEEEVGVLTGGNTSMAAKCD